MIISSGIVPNPGILDYYTWLPFSKAFWQFVSDKLTLALRSFQNPSLDTASDKFYVVTCDKQHLASLWAESASINVG